VTGEFLFTSDLFKEDVSSSVYIASNRGMIVNNELGWKWSWSTLRLSRNIYLEGLRKTTRKLVQTMFY
jgi:hypothetical protein